MGDWGFDDFKAYLKIQFGNRDDLETTGASSDINLYGVWVNLAYKELVNRNRWWGRKIDFYFPQLETDTNRESSAITTTDGTEYVSVPTDALIIRDIWDETNDRSLDRIASWNEYVDYTGRDDTSAENKPTEWIRNGTYIYLYPTPDATYTLRVYYRKIPADLTSSGVTLIGSEWDEIILLGAKIKGKTWLGDKDDLEETKKEWAEKVDGLVGIYSEEERDINVRAKPASEGLNYDFKR